MPSSNSFSKVYSGSGSVRSVYKGEALVWSEGLILDFTTGLPAGFTFARASGQMVRASNGTATWLANDAYPLHYSAGGVALGALLERGATNLCPHSVNLKNGSGVTRTQAAGVAPNGANEAGLAIEDTATSLHYFWYNDVTRVAGDKNITSIFIKPQGRLWTRVYAATSLYQSYDLVGGMLGATNNAVGGWIEPWNDGWMRCSLRTLQTFTGSNTGPAVRMGTAHNVINYAGDGASGQFVWGGEWVADYYPTSHIPTSGSVAARAATALSGTFAVRALRKIRVMGIAPLGVRPDEDQFICALTGNGGSNLIEVYRDYTDRHVKVYYNSTSVDLGELPDGATMDLGGSTALVGAPEVDRIYVGTDALGGRHWDSTIKAITLA